MLADLITRVSAEIAAYCNNRVFGFETVVETFTEIPADLRRLFLARFPIPLDDSGITSITIEGTASAYPNGYLLDSLWGKLQLPANGGVHRADGDQLHRRIQLARRCAAGAQAGVRDPCCAKPTTPACAATRPSA